MNNSDDSKYVATRDRDFNLMYKMVRVNSADIDTATYQRKLDKNKVRRIAAEFDERIANEPKLSYRDGKYYVFDGQHTIAARKSRNKELDVDIICKVYFDMTPEEEAMLFAAQTGISSKPTPGVTLKAKSMGRDNETLAFIKANAAFDIQPSYSDVKGKCRLRYQDEIDMLMEKEETTLGDAEKYERAIVAIYEKIAILREQLRLAKAQAVTSENVSLEIERFLRAMKEYEDADFTEYNDVLVRRLIEVITVMPDKTMEVVLKGGMRKKMIM